MKNPNEQQTVTFLGEDGKKANVFTVLEDHDLYRILRMPPDGVRDEFREAKTDDEALESMVDDDVLESMIEVCPLAKHEGRELAIVTYYPDIIGAEDGVELLVDYREGDGDKVYALMLSEPPEEAAAEQYQHNALEIMREVRGKTWNEHEAIRWFKSIYQKQDKK